MKDKNKGRNKVHALGMIIGEAIVIHDKETVTRKGYERAKKALNILDFDKAEQMKALNGIGFRECVQTDPFFGADPDRGMIVKGGGL